MPCVTGFFVPLDLVIEHGRRLREIPSIWTSCVIPPVHCDIALTLQTGRENPARPYNTSEGRLRVDWDRRFVDQQTIGSDGVLCAVRNLEGIVSSVLLRRTSHYDSFSIFISFSTSKILSIGMAPISCSRQKDTSCISTLRTSNPRRQLVASSGRWTTLNAQRTAEDS